MIGGNPGKIQEKLFCSSVGSSLKKVAMPQPERPFGVTVLVLISLISALITLLSVLDPARLPVDLPQFLRFYSQVTPSDILNVLLVPVELFLVFGLWYLKRWAWVLYMIRLGLSMMLNLNAHFSGTDPNYLLMALDVLLVFYLNQRDVQQAFGYRTGFQEEEMLP